MPRSPSDGSSLRADASGLVQISLRVPAALTADDRALDTLSVAIDPETLGRMEVTADAGMVTGVEAHVLVFARGEPRPARERFALGPGVDFNVGATTWSAKRDGLPMPDAKYVVEMQLVLFETDVPSSRAWDPHAGTFKSLWTRTLRQAEE